MRAIMSIGEGFDINIPNFFFSFLDPSRGKWSYNYVGLLPLILTPISLLNKRERAHVLFFLGAIAFCILVALVEWGEWLWVLRIPTIAIFRGLHRIMFIGALCFGLIAGFGWDALQAGSDDSESTKQSATTVWKWVPLASLPIFWFLIWHAQTDAVRSIYVVTPLALLLIIMRRSRSKGLPLFIKIGVVITVFADLASGTIKPLAFPLRTPEVFHRYDPLWQLIREHQDHSRSHLQFATLDRRHMAVAEKYGQLKRIRTITDYEPLISGRYKDIMLRAQAHPFPETNIFYGYFSHLSPDTARMKILSLMGTRFFVVFKSDISEDLAPGHRKWWTDPPPSLRLVFEQADVRVYENPAALPRAYVVHDFRVIEDSARLLEELDSISFDPRAAVLLSETPKDAASMMADTPRKESSSNAAVFLKDAPEEVEIRIQSDRPGFLVLSDSHYPGWKASVNEQPRHIYRANYHFRAVPIPQGESTVRFTYVPASFGYGRAISIISLLCAGAVVIVILRRRARTASEQN
jgi:hypothetical protein